MEGDRRRLTDWLEVDKKKKAQTESKAPHRSHASLQCISITPHVCNKLGDSLLLAGLSLLYKRGQLRVINTDTE